MKLLSPAKINLFLEVTGKRKNGFHNIETIFQTISLYDEIELKLSNQIEILCNVKELENERNLAYVAAKKLRDHTGVKKGVIVKIKKNIPIASGLGGGSSNAATVILGLLKLWGLSIKTEKMIEIAKGIGADVPFFLYGGCCIAKGIGDKLYPIKPFWYRKPLDVLLFTFNFGIKSKDIYSIVNVPKNPKNVDKAPLDDIDTLLFNRLEDVILENYQDVKMLKQELVEKGYSRTLVSGSGPTIFSIIQKGEKFPPSTYKYITTKTIFPKDTTITTKP